MTFIDQYKNVRAVETHARFADRCLKLIDDGCNYSLLRTAQKCHKIFAGTSLYRLNATMHEGAGDLIIQIDAIRYHHDLVIIPVHAIGLLLLQRDGFGKHYHGQTLAAALSVPDYSARAPPIADMADTFQNGAYGEVLLVSRNLLLARIEN